MAKRNILFLDFDGPLTNARAWFAYDKPAGRAMWTTADPVAIEMLNLLVKDFNILTVVSSTWRKFDKVNPTGIAADWSLRQWGFIGEFHPDWKTPVLPGENRNDEIRDWMRRNHESVDNFASLDDMDLRVYTNNVKVDAEDGISSANYRQVCNFLSGGGWSVQQHLDKFKP